jgi:nucleoside-diphosphate-sugar epimerase
VNRVLVTGAFGLIGGALLEVLCANEIQVTALSNVEPGAGVGSAVCRVFVGDAGHVELVRAALADVDAVVHLAAIPTPLHDPGVDVFAGNTRATFVVLDEAGQAGVRKAVIASSYSILGLPFARGLLHPAYFPIDIDTPPQVEDPYGLSKQVDEATARMVGRRYGMDIVALRFPFVGGGDRISARLRATLADPGIAARESWAYLDVRDAAEAIWLALRADIRGVLPVYLAAPQILAPWPTEELIRRYHPDSEIRRALVGREVPIELAAAAEVLGFQARHLVALEARPLP